MAKQRNARLKKEMLDLATSPPAGIHVNPEGGEPSSVSCQIIGPPDTPYETGIFKISLTLPERYPFEPPAAKFTTKIYHPNIDENGRICLDLFHLPPKGCWKPIHNIRTLLTSIRLLLADPNPDDALLADVANQYKFNRPLFVQEAKRFTEKYAKGATPTDVKDCVT